VVKFSVAIRNVGEPWVRFPDYALRFLFAVLSAIRIEGLMNFFYLCFYSYIANCQMSFFMLITLIMLIMFY
jgi:hypothetical protein